MSEETTPVEPSQSEPSQPELSQTEDEPTRLQRALEEKSREAEAHYDRYLRAAAELDNARKRAQRDREEYIRFANESLLREILPVLDNFDRALGAARLSTEAQGFVAGVELIQRELLKVLEKFGVTPYSALGQPFDPERHEAVQRVVKPDAPDMTVVEETLRGYLLNGRVLRPAMVVVAVPPDSENA
ncbi:MAG: nucleotide exchange factor GrpE [Candidatus Rokubacteria bacterium]|nr:nucleotide exchange factor GrpE [Candidatus Rokubacteria bacterium]